MSRTSTAVAIIGAGPAGLMLANLLRRADVDCRVLERQSRKYVEQRQRAGVVEHRNIRLLEQSGLGHVLDGARPQEGLEIRVGGETRFLPCTALADGRQLSSIPQQVVVQRLIEAFLAGGGDLAFETADVALHDLTSERPRVTYRDSEGATHEIEADVVAGCDGDHGVTRTAVPDEVLAMHAHDYGIRWLTVVAETPPPRHSLFAVSAHGFAAHFPRGPRAGRFCLQCAADDDLADWPDDRVWEQLRLRLGSSDLPSGSLTEKTVLEMRSVVYEPMSFGRLYLTGDAAHIITPMGAKGMNLALQDADDLARAITAFVRDGDEEPLDRYSETCLRRVWDCQEFSYWMTEMFHDSGDGSQVGPFRQRLARARLDRLFVSQPSATAFAELMVGTE